MPEEDNALAARAAAKAHFAETLKIMVETTDWTRHDAEFDLLARMMFGIPGKDLTEDQDGSVIAWMCRERPVERLHRGAVRDAAIALGRLTLLFADLTDRLEGHCRECEYLDLMIEAHADGTVAGMTSICERLETSWHDVRLSREEGIEAVEAVEALRLALRRMEACGLTALSSFDAADPASYPARP